MSIHHILLDKTAKLPLFCKIDTFYLLSVIIPQKKKSFTFISRDTQSIKIMQLFLRLHETEF